MKTKHWIVDNLEHVTKNSPQIVQAAELLKKMNWLPFQQKQSMD